MMFRQCRAIMLRELFYMWRDRSLRNLLLVGPLLGLLLFAGVYSSQRIGSIATGIVDLDNSSASRQVVAELKNTQNLQVVAYFDNFAQLEESIKRDEVIVGVVIPENYGKNIALQRQTKVAVFIDGMNMAYATNASSAALTITRTLGAQVGIQSLVAKGIQTNQAQEAYQSIDFPEEAWFNPTANYAYFLVLAFALNVWQQFCTLASCMIIIGENGLRSWLQIKASGISLLKLFVCKSLVHIGVLNLIALPVYYLAFVVYKLPLACGWPNFLLFSFLFTLALHGLCTMMSSYSPNAVNATRYGMIIALPSFLISGYTWPLEAMPHWFQPLAWIFPQTWFFQGVSYLTFKNPGWGFMSRYYGTLGLMAVIFYSAAVIGFKVSNFFRKG